MQELFDLLLAYAPYIAIPMVVAGLVQSLKTGFYHFFKETLIGVRILPFLPAVIGCPLGLLTPISGVGASLLVGAALGTVSSLIYEALTVSLARKAKLVRKIEKLGGESSEV